MLKFNFRCFRNKIDSFPSPKNYNLIENERILETKVPIHLPSDLEKVKKAPFGISLEQEFKKFFATEYTSGPFYQYQLENVLLIKDRIYFDNYEYPLNPLKKVTRFYDSKDILEFEQASFSSMRISSVFFGHWLREELILIDYLQDKSNIVMSSPTTPQKNEILNLFNLNCHMTQFARIKTTYMYEGWQHSTFYIDTLMKYKQKISHLSGRKENNRKSLVYLKRGSSAVKRTLENEEILLESLSKDFDVSQLVAESTPIIELYAAIYGADILVSIEGSQIAHAIISAKPGATLVCIQPPKRFYNPFKKYSADAGIRYAVVVADQGTLEDSFNVNIDHFKRLLEKIESDC